MIARHVRLQTDRTPLPAARASRRRSASDLPSGMVAAFHRRTFDSGCAMRRRCRSGNVARQDWIGLDILVKLDSNTTKPGRRFCPCRFLLLLKVVVPRCEREEARRIAANIAKPAGATTPNVIGANSDVRYPEVKWTSLRRAAMCC